MCIMRWGKKINGTDRNLFRNLFNLEIIFKEYACFLLDSF